MFIHPYHNLGHISLLSVDGTILMADSWRLARSSTFFAGLFDLPPPTPGQTSYPKDLLSLVEPIEMEFFAEVIDLFLNLINVSKPSIPSSAFPQTMDLLELCDKYDVNENIQGLVRDRLLMQIGDRQWQLLIWSGKRNDIHMAGEALPRMTPHSFIASTTYESPRKGLFVPLWYALGKLPQSWQLEIIRLAFIPINLDTRPGVKSYQFEVTGDWDSVSQKFTPK
ncbi:hypothetical protein I204_05297 [Kwoniella mangroviensis CBS 8886]|uniref:uncharacterized protein n=1 Tax=Kwoniella mangroviensis CBS 8507 TaxID=1296122 RepID=UPI00080CC8E3|nr:uncharacterized protein I203_04650 [Kwoniella mangroviensis CBS 8507]OCF66319.1 hypothetical protein I203_04650 [Kwoniella mangroviensis CBS 8507]OCF73456.1 hypothetical protein I204_05297 [Kwoniella mangroviensis CBS 8886]